MIIPDKLCQAIKKKAIELNDNGPAQKQISLFKNWLLYDT